MTKASTKTYTIRVQDWVLTDPKFSKKTTKYLPISTAFLGAKSIESLSLGEFKLMISLIEECHNRSRSVIEVDKKFLRSQGKVAEKSLFKLNEFKYLEFPLNKEIKELINEEKPIISESDPILKLEKENEESFAKKFQSFVVNEMGSNDLGYVQGYWKKAHKAFLNFEGLREFIDQIYEAKGFNTIEKRKGQIAYFKVSLSKELEARGVK